MSDKEVVIAQDETGSVIGHVGVPGSPPPHVRRGMSMEQLLKTYPALQDRVGRALPGDDRTISTRGEGRSIHMGLDMQSLNPKVVNALVPDQVPQPVRQVSAGSLAKTFLAWQTNRRKPVTRREVKKFLDKLWPDITGEELWRRTKITWEVVAQLQDNGWLESEEAIRMKEFDLRTGSTKGLTMRVAGG